MKLLKIVAATLMVLVLLNGCAICKTDGQTIVPDDGIKVTYLGSMI